MFEPLLNVQAEMLLHTKNNAGGTVIQKSGDRVKGSFLIIMDATYIVEESSLDFNSVSFSVCRGIPWKSSSETHTSKVNIVPDKVEILHRRTTHPKTGSLSATRNASIIEEL